MSLLYNLEAETAVIQLDADARFKYFIDTI
jgi:hypothetical protein